MAKDKSKKEVMAAIAGKTVAIGLSDKTPYFVNTGHYGLNMVLSGRWAGGWPGGRVSEIFGDPSCLVAGTKVVLEDGSMVPIETLGNIHLQNIKVSMQTGGEGVETARVFHKYEKQPVIEIILNDGRRLVGTYNHPLLRYQEYQDVWNWARLDSLKKGDIIKSADFIPCKIDRMQPTNFKKFFNNYGPQYDGTIPQEMSLPLAAVMGYILGDGWVSHKAVVLLVNAEEQDILKKLLPYMQKLFRVAPAIYERTSAPRYYKGVLFNGTQPVTLVEYNRKAMAEALSFLRIKRVPDIIFRSDNTIVAEFLKWLFEADGCAIKLSCGRGRVCLKSSETKLVQDVQLLLLRFGIKSQVIEGVSRKFGFAYAQLIIRQRSSVKVYAEIIGFVSIKKTKKLKDIIRNQGWKRKSTAYASTRVVKIIKHRKKQDVYDVELPIGHRFIANGITSHNTGKSILVMRAMTSMQRGEILIVDDNYDKAESYVILDDTEKAYVSEFCTSLGFDVEDLVEMKKSKTVEGHFQNAMETIKKIRSMNKAAPIGVFLDSIAQLSTTHEVEKGMDKRDMNKAGKIHQAMRLYSDDINEFGAFYLIANHVIANIGAMFGPQRVVKGGSGIAFQSSVRVDLKYKTKFVRNKQKTDESGDRGEAYGTKVVAIAEKNKITTPFKFTAIDIYYATGVDPYSGLFDYFSRQGNIILVEDAKGGKNPKGAQYEFRAKDDDGHIADKVGVTFEKKDLEHFIIENDILGLKKQKIKYMEPTTEAPELEEVLEEEEQHTPAPPPLAITREAKV